MLLLFSETSKDLKTYMLTEITAQEQRSFPATKKCVEEKKQQDKEDNKKSIAGLMLFFIIFIVLPLGVPIICCLCSYLGKNNNTERELLTKEYLKTNDANAYFKELNNILEDNRANIQAISNRVQISITVPNEFYKDIILNKIQYLCQTFQKILKKNHLYLIKYQSIVSVIQQSPNFFKEWLRLSNEVLQESLTLYELEYHDEQNILDLNYYTQLTKHAFQDIEQNQQ